MTLRRTHSLVAIERTGRARRAGATRSRTRSQTFLGGAPLRAAEGGVAGRTVSLDGEDFYRIENYDRMPPFFTTAVSNADHWLFAWSNGGITAGRRDPNLALFPYYTDDKLRDMAGVTGSKTVLRVRRARRLHLWEPFVADCRVYRLRRNLYKNLRGNKLLFEEINDDLKLAFRYGWSNSQRFGFVRQAWLENAGDSRVAIEVLDGLQNIMPCGTNSRFNLEYSTLLDAYKRNELLPDSGLGLIHLSAIPVDRPEPAEALRTNAAWVAGLAPRCVLLSSTQISAFRRGEALHPERDVRAKRGAYLVQARFALPPRRQAEWMMVGDVNLGATEVVALDRALRRPDALRRRVLRDVAEGTRELGRMVGSADGLQLSRSPVRDARHYANTLFNIMRGGVFTDGYAVDRTDFAAFLRSASGPVSRPHAAFLGRLPATLAYDRLVARAAATGDPQLERVCREYLPLTFSRRHGDPSRPWNQFAIATRNEDGTRKLGYEGNWRDIFQNWEALTVPFPGFTSGMICRFLNASTADGYNPYRITRDGIDWEVTDPHDPWSYIGYWGDHQVIYLLKLLEQLQCHQPDELRRLLSHRIFAYANVPYRIAPYPRLLANPKETVTFDQALDAALHRRAEANGADGKLLSDHRGRVRLVTLAEKLLVPLLAKLSNFVPGAGIWLNTQRPEWNDANNALVGNGCSMVTLYYLRRYLAFLTQLLAPEDGRELELSAEVAAFFGAVRAGLSRHEHLLAGEFTDAARRRVLDDLGRAGSRYRQRLYKHGLSGRTVAVPARRVSRFLALATRWLDHSIASNRRDDGLYHAYNLVRFSSHGHLPIRRLCEMHEGQVAVLSSGALSPEESLAVLRALRRSAMYRRDQHSYTLYPDRALPPFVEQNDIPPSAVRRSQLLRRLLRDGNRRLVERDVEGRVHFNGSISSAADVRRVLDELRSGSYGALVGREAAQVLHVFDQVFDHESFTGRSGRFFGYEGLGCIYWHMVSKLLLATQECYFQALETGAPAAVIRGLAERYRDIRAGLGDAKTPEAYGAFPMDPYSHTPGHGGARQPGLTGQVKEDFLCRFGELGVRVRDGRLHFTPALLQRSEFLQAPARFRYFDLAGRERSIALHPGELAFTYCQVPVVVGEGKFDRLRLRLVDGSRVVSHELSLDTAASHKVFGRTGDIVRIDVTLGRPTAGAGGRRPRPAQSSKRPVSRKRAT